MQWRSAACWLTAGWLLPMGVCAQTQPVLPPLSVPPSPARAQPVAQPPPVTLSPNGFINFSFEQVELRLLIRLVGDLTGKRFVVPDTVTGKVTVVSPSRIGQDEIYPLFLSILEGNGYTVHVTGGAHHIVPLVERSVLAVAPDNETADGGMVTKVIKLEHISASEMRKTLEPMVRGGKNGALSAFAPSNHLIITDTAGNVARIERVIREMDQPGAARTIEVIQLQQAAAEDVAGQLMTAMRGAQTTPGSQARLQLQNMRDGMSSLPVELVIVPSPQANSLVVVGTPMELMEVKSIVEKIDVEASGGYGRLNAIFLKYLNAEEAAKSLNALLGKTTVKDQRQRIAIEPSIANNALLVEASSQDVEYVRRLVADLDQVPQQVLVEVLIAEVNLSRSKDIGAEWRGFEVGDSVKPFGYMRFTDQSDPIMDLVTQGITPQGMALGLSKGAIQYTTSDGQTIAYPNIPLMIKAMAGNKDIKILSNVPLWAQNNKEATVSIVENRPVLKSTVEGGAGTSRDFIQNVDRIDVGIKLKLTPHVNPSREVMLQLNPSIEAVVEENTSGLTASPRIAKREVSTTVTVPDKATVVISGLIREDTFKTVTKIPVLGDIPLLGVLFRSTSDKKERTNLLVFVTPHIVTDIEDAMKLKASIEKQSWMDGADKPAFSSKPVVKEKERRDGATPSSTGPDTPQAAQSESPTP